MGSQRIERMLFKCVVECAGESVLQLARQILWQDPRQLLVLEGAGDRSKVATRQRLARLLFDLRLEEALGVAVQLGCDQVRVTESLLLTIQPFKRVLGLGFLLVVAPVFVGRNVGFRLGVGCLVVLAHRPTPFSSIVLIATLRPQRCSAHRAHSRSSDRRPPSGIALSSRGV